MNGLKECWKKFSFGPYEVSNIGRIRNFTTGRIKVASRSSNGYLIFGAYMGGKRKNVLVHRAVAECFLGPCPRNHCVNHRDGNKLNNVLKNLGFLDRHKVYFSMWEEVLASFPDTNTVADLLQTIVFEETIVIKVEGCGCKEVYYSNPIKNPCWMQIILATELGIRYTGDYNHCFMEFIYDAEEVKSGCKVIGVALGS